MASLAVAAAEPQQAISTPEIARVLPAAPLEDQIPLEWSIPEASSSPVSARQAPFETLEWTPPHIDHVIAEEKVRAAVAALFASDAIPAEWRTDEFTAIAEYYAARDFQPLWSDGGQLSSAAVASMERIAQAADDGLDPAAYRLPTARDTDPATLARTDVELSLAVAAYARHAQSGRLEPRTISPLITARPERPDPAYVLARVSASTNAAQTLDDFNPPHEGFRDLRRKLAALSIARTEPLPHIPDGPLLKPGMDDPRVPVLRARLALPHSEDTGYDTALADAVRAFQRSKGLRDEAVVGRQTLAALNEEISSDPYADALVNMERWRWLPRDLGRTHVFVNIPEFHARVVSDGAVVHETRVIVGTEKNQTPIFSDAIQFLIVNPSWNVPYSIARKEMLPKLQQDPTYLARQGIEVVHVRGGRRQVLDSTAIDWTNTSLKGLHFRQPPGERNALGHIKFMFPNEHSVYLHDTPSRNLFGRASRAFSHGCVRVEDPFALAEALLGTRNGWTKDKVKRLVGGAERRINLPEKIPVHLAYFTAWVDGGGVLKKHADIYGHDRRMRAALNLGS